MVQESKTLAWICNTIVPMAHWTQITRDAVSIHSARSAVHSPSWARPKMRAPANRRQSSAHWSRCTRSLPCSPTMSINSNQASVLIESMVVLYVSRSSSVKYIYVYTYIGLGISDIIFLEAIIIRLSSRLSFTAIQLNRCELIMCQQCFQYTRIIQRLFTCKHKL